MNDEERPQGLAGMSVGDSTLSRYFLAYENADLDERVKRLETMVEIRAAKRRFLGAP